MLRSLLLCCIACVVAAASTPSTALAQQLEVATEPAGPPKDVAPAAASEARGRPSSRTNAASAPISAAATDGEKWDWLLPIRGCRVDGRDAAVFFSLKETKVLSNFDMTVWRDQASLHTEVASDTGFCFFRLGLGVTMAKASGSATDAVPPDQKEAVQRLVTSGGNVSIAGAAPLLFHRFDTRDRQSWVGVFVAPKLGTDMPLLSESSHFSGNTDIGVEAHGVYSTDNQRFSFYARARGSWLWTTKNYADQVGMDGRETWLAQGMIGVRITDFFQLSLTFLFYAPQAIRDRYPDALFTLTATTPDPAPRAADAAAKPDHARLAPK